MRVKDKLVLYFRNCGRMKTWFSRHMGMSNETLSAIYHGRMQLPKKYWKEMVAKSEGYVKPEDIVSDYLVTHFQKFPFIKLHEDYENKVWTITIDFTES